jgi:hypothetical protein
MNKFCKAVVRFQYDDVVVIAVHFWRALAVHSLCPP